MILPENCRELFLDGITDAYFYAVQDSTLPIPFSVQRVLQMNGCKFAGEGLHLAIGEGDNYVEAESITAKQTSSEAGNGTVFTFEISATISAGKENVPEVSKNMRSKDYYIVLRKQDDSLYLCFTLPGTFSFTTSITNQSNSESRTITATCKAMSEFIPITIS